jgi:putative transposase
MVMAVNRSAYYRYLQKKDKQKNELDIKLTVELKSLHKQSRKSYGTRRMAKALSIGRFKARRLMRQNGISCKQRRRYTVTTRCDHIAPVAENILNRDFHVDQPNRKWVADITYLWTDEGWFYLAAVLDLFSRRVVGWAMADHMQTDLIENAFSMAIQRRNPTDGLLHHSDRGTQYTSQQYQQALQKFKVIVSMSRKGNCWDNAVMERFFGTLKSERTDGTRYATRAAAKADVIDFIEMFYNAKRLHSTLNYVSPSHYEQLNAMESRMKSAMPAVEAIAVMHKIKYDNHVISKRAGT